VRSFNNRFWLVQAPERSSIGDPSTWQRDREEFPTLILGRRKVAETDTPQINPVQAVGVQDVVLEGFDVLVAFGELQSESSIAINATSSRDVVLRGTSIQPGAGWRGGRGGVNLDTRARGGATGDRGATRGEDDVSAEYKKIGAPAFAGS